VCEANGVLVVGLEFFVVSQESKFLKFLGFMWNPLSWVMEAAALMAIVLANGQVSRKTIKMMIIGFFWFGLF
jgi:hypothetical protein